MSTLHLFEATLHNNAATIFAGGPIWASAWCPTKNKDYNHVVALFAEKVLCTLIFQPQRSWAIPISKFKPLAGIK